MKIDTIYIVDGINENLSAIERGLIYFTFSLYNMRSSSIKLAII